MKANTLGFVYYVYHELNRCCELFGADEAFIKEASLRFNKISQAMCREFNRPIEKIREMPMDTKLPPVAEEKLLELAEWLARDDKLKWVWLEISNQKQNQKIDEIIDEGIPGWQPGS